MSFPQAFLLIWSVYLPLKKKNISTPGDIDLKLILQKTFFFVPELNQINQNCYNFL